jgi:hypothetical protein
MLIKVSCKAKDLKKHMKGLLDAANYTNVGTLGDLSSNMLRGYVVIDKRR